MDNFFDIAVIGGGIVGVSAAYKLLIANPGLKILLLEKEKKFAAHQTGHNSGVIHSGLYYKPGSKKAEYCLSGRSELLAFARKYKINHDVCGKVVVAVDGSELPYLEGILENGKANYLKGIEGITGNEVKDIEPFVECIAGIYVPETGIIDYVSVTEKLIEIIRGISPSSQLLTACKVIGVTSENDHQKIHTDHDQFISRNIIFCGGLQADRLARMDKIQLKEKIVGFRGDYYKLTDSARDRVKNLIYPVPNPKFPFLGVHFTRMVNGDVECGPNAVLTFKREGYGKTDFNLADTVDALTYPGTWKLLAGNFGFAMREYRRSFSKKLFLKTLQRMIPTLTMEDIIPAGSGVRAQFLGLDGDTREDFKIEFSKNSIHVLNAPSPAATASLAIGEEISRLAAKRFKLRGV
jgi:L-2-hydroxyglutarate oxidase